MRLILTKEDPCWVVLTGPSPKLIEALKTTVRPINRRKFSTFSSKWVVHYQWLGWLVNWARGLGHTVDWSALPEQWQIICAGGTVSPSSAVTVDNPYSLLFTTEQAPDVVLKAIYKALVILYHPDAGGDKEKFLEMDQAYKKILAIRDLTKL